MMMMMMMMTKSCDEDLLTPLRNRKKRRCALVERSHSPQHQQQQQQLQTPFCSQPACFHAAVCESSRIPTKKSPIPLSPSTPQRCILGDMRFVLEKDGGYLQGQTMLSALSKIQRELDTSDFLKSEHLRNKSEVEDDDCSLGKIEARPCMNDIKGLSSHLVFLLGSSNRFTCHSAAKTLLILLRYLEEVPLFWISAIQEIWNSLRAWFCDDENAFGGKLSEKRGSSERKHHTEQKNWNFIACVLQMLHDALRNCKCDGGSKLITFLSTFEICIREFVVNFSRYFLKRNSKDRDKEGDLALAALLRFLCSITHAMGIHSDLIKSKVRNGILEPIKEFATAISQHCLDVYKRSLPCYLQHKFLMLLFRLCEWLKENPSLGIVCINILEPHLDVLCGSLFLRKPQTTDSLMRSPFAKCLIDGEETEGSTSSSNHPGKYAVFLIFKVVVSLKIASCTDDLRIEANTGHPVDWWEQWLVCWLASQIDSIGDVLNADLFEVADSFAFSFLEIFVDEDTLLLNVLLLLLDIDALQILQRGIHVGDEPLLDSRKLVVEIFKPARVFAVFISLIRYDHSVILDFLISNNTSVCCLQYLLRSVRIVNNTWPELVALSHTCFMRNDGACYSVDVEEVANCVMALKHTIEGLNSKNAFPYNPSPLLKRLNSFEQLWLQSKTDD